MPAAAARLERLDRRRRRRRRRRRWTRCGAALDDDLDTPGAVAAIDAAVERGEGVASSAALLGVFLVGDPLV